MGEVGLHEGEKSSSGIDFSFQSASVSVTMSVGLLTALPDRAGKEAELGRDGALPCATSLGERALPAAALEDRPREAECAWAVRLDDGDDEDGYADWEEPRTRGRGGELLVDGVWSNWT